MNYIVAYLYAFLRDPDWGKAAEYYGKYISIREMQTEADVDDSAHNTIPYDEQHDIVARLATLYKTGDHNLECNYQKAGEKNPFYS